MSTSSDEKYRVFFSIQPDNEALQQILFLQKSNKIEKAKFLQPDQIHLTLLFLGTLDKKSLDCIQQSTRQIKHQQIHLRFDQTGVFKKAGILWLGSDLSDKNLIELNQKLQNIASQCRVITESRPFKAHITLARKFSGNYYINPERTIEFTATDFQLMKSVQTQVGVKYEILESYDLTLSS